MGDGKDNHHADKGCHPQYSSYNNLGDRTWEMERTIIMLTKDAIPLLAILQYIQLDHMHLHLQLHMHIHMHNMDLYVHHH